MMAGVVTKVRSMADGLKESPDLVLFDGVGEGALADKLIGLGWNVFGAHKICDEIELDRKFGIDFMEKNGIRVPPTMNFTGVDAAIKHVEKNPKGYVIKMDSEEATKDSSFVAKDAEKMLNYLNHLKDKKLVKDGESFVLQDFVKGVEVDTEVLFSKGRPVMPYNNDFETKKFLAGDLGPNTGCQTSVLFGHTSGNSMMVEKTISKVFKAMEKAKYTCVLGFNSIVSEKDHEPYGLEWTARMGYSSIYAMCAMCADADLGEMFLGLATGKIDELPMRFRWGTSILASAPPFPLQVPDDDKIQEKLYGKSRGEKIVYKDGPHVWLQDYMKNEEGEDVIAGDDGCIAELTGAADSLPKAWKMSQKGFDDMDFPNKQGRYTDGIESATKRVNQLREWGYDMPSPNVPLALEKVAR